VDGSAIRGKDYEGSQQFDSGGRSGEEAAGSSHAPRSPALAPAEPDARFLPGAAASPASGLASDGPGRGGIGGATAPHGPPHINEQNEGTVIGLDTKCPYVGEHTSEKELAQYVREVASVLESPAVQQLVGSNPSLVQRHQDDVIFVYPVEGLTRALKGQGT
jgi:hypothetical protein